MIRGDNYCAIRATLFQALVKNIPILEQFGNSSIEEVNISVHFSSSFVHFMFTIDTCNYCGYG